VAKEKREEDGGENQDHTRVKQIATDLSTLISHVALELRLSKRFKLLNQKLAS